MHNIENTPSAQAPLTVSQLTGQVKVILEHKFPFIWVTGEISNLSVPVSGHCYFTLKDAQAQISAVVFRGQMRQLRFDLKNGMAVTGLGRISVYPPRGTYQIIFEHLEPRGIGALQVAFEQLKARLEAEGLFDDRRKKQLPFLPRRIALVTSATGAVVHDMCSILRRRMPSLSILLVPVKVQGAEAAVEIATALEDVQRVDVAVVILARGGGSLEDLQAFNTETVARAIAASHTPVISAIGHETDYTIADFVADMRAPTPSAAAECVVPEKVDLLRQVHYFQATLVRRMRHQCATLHQRLHHLSENLVDPVKRIEDAKLRCDDLSTRLVRTMERLLGHGREHISFRIKRLTAASPGVISRRRERDLILLNNRLINTVLTDIKDRKNAANEKNTALHAFNPLAVLSRGYSLTRTLTEGVIVRGGDQVTKGQRLEILLGKGRLLVRVEEVMDPSDRATA